MNENDRRPRGAMSVNDFAIWAGIGRTSAWKEIRERRLRAVKVSARTIVSMEEAQRWLSTRPSVFDNDQHLAQVG
jgi:hypothetical protein